MTESQVSKQAQFIADYLWHNQAANYPDDDEASDLYMFLDHNLDKAIKAWSDHHDNL